MSDYKIPSIYNKISSDNYLINSYNHLTRRKSIHFLFIIIEMLINILQEIETFLRGFSSEKIKTDLNYISYITSNFDKLHIVFKLIIIFLFMFIFDLLYFIL